MIQILIAGGKSGVFDVEELVALLRGNKMFDICAIKIPEDTLLGEHMVIVSALSVRHMRAVQLLVRKIVSPFFPQRFIVPGIYRTY